MESSNKPIFSSQNPRSTEVPQNIQRKLSTNHQKLRNKKKTSPKSQQLPSSLMGCIPKHSPLHASPSYPSRSPPRIPYRSPQNAPPQMASSLPVISIDETVDAFSAGTSRFGTQPEVMRARQPPDFVIPEDDQTGILPISSDSSSDSFSSGSDSETESNTIKYGNGHTNGTNTVILQDNLLKEDLQLSESGSDSE